MRRWSSFGLVFLVVAFAPVFQVAAQTTSLIPGGLTALPTLTMGPKLLTDAGFEAISGGLPAGWTGSSAWASDQLTKHGGLYSYRRGSGAPTSSQTVQLRKGQYKLSGWVETEGITTGAVRLQLEFRVGGTNDWVTTGQIKRPTGSTTRSARSS